MVVGDQLLEDKPSSVILNGGAQHSYPTELDEVLFRFGLIRGGEELARYLGESIRESSPPPPRTRTLLDWLADRLSGPSRRSDRDLYPRQGMGQLLERCAALISDLGGELRLGATATGFSLDGRRVRAVRFEDSAGGTRELPCRSVISTLALPSLVNMLGDVPHDVQRSNRALHFRSLRVLNLQLEGSSAVSDHTWLYVSEAKYLTARIHEPIRRSREMAPAGATSLMLEIPCEREGEIWKLPRRPPPGPLSGGIARAGARRPARQSPRPFLHFRPRGLPPLPFRLRGRPPSSPRPRRQIRWGHDHRAPRALPPELTGLSPRDGSRRRTGRADGGWFRGRGRPCPGNLPQTPGGAMKRLLAVGLLALAGCPVTPPPPNVVPALEGTLVNTRFDVAQHMRASMEMQLSGEPFAELLGYNLAGFDRTRVPTDQYTLDGGNAYVTDPLGFALAVETYEYSKQPMNNLTFEAGAGLSLMFGPVLNPAQQGGTAGYQLLLHRFQTFAAQTASGGPVQKSLVVSPAPVDNPMNPYGWPGLWPVFAEFSSFDPAIAPIPGAVKTCTFKGSVGVYGGGMDPSSDLISNYECDSNSLHLIDRETQVDKTLTSDALGYVVWKQGLWTINYWQGMQDSAGDPIATVDNPDDIPKIGQPGNTVVGSYPDPADPTGVRMLQGTPGTYLGDIALEGWQGLLMMDAIDNKAAFLLGSLLTSDGATLQGASVLTAIDYAYDSPLLFFPAAVSVIETPQTSVPGYRPTRDFPQPTSLAIRDGSSHLGALSGLLGGFSEAFAFTDRNNALVGGSVPLEATFDGDPFPRDNGLPDGENTLHDRTLGILKVALVDLDRLHFDPSARVLVDTASVVNGTVVRGNVVSTVELAESILALRNAFRSLNGSLQHYSNDTPDEQGSASALDGVSLSGASYDGTLANHVMVLIGDEADFLMSKLVSPSGAVANSFDLGTGTVDGGPTVLEAEAGAIRGLLEAYLATSNEKYRNAAVGIYGDLQQRFWATDVLCFRTTVGVDDLFQYTPIRFGLLEAALRQYYKLVAGAPGHEAEGTQLLERAEALLQAGDQRLERPEPGRQDPVPRRMHRRGTADGGARADRRARTRHRSGRSRPRLRQRDLQGRFARRPRLRAGPPATVGASSLESWSGEPDASSSSPRCLRLAHRCAHLARRCAGRAQQRARLRRCRDNKAHGRARLARECARLAGELRWPRAAAGSLHAAAELASLRPGTASRVRSSASSHQRSRTRDFPLRR